MGIYVKVYAWNEKFGIGKDFESFERKHLLTTMAGLRPSEELTIIDFGAPLCMQRTLSLNDFGGFLYISQSTKLQRWGVAGDWFKLCGIFYILNVLLILS